MWLSGRAEHWNRNCNNSFLVVEIYLDRLPKLIIYMGNTAMQFPMLNCQQTGILITNKTENHVYWFIPLDSLHVQYRVLALVCPVNNPSSSPFLSSFCNLMARRFSHFSRECMSYQQRDANLLESYALLPCYFCYTHVAWEVSSVAGFLLGWIAWRQKLISNSTEINDFALTCSLAQQRLCAFLGDRRCKYL